MSNEYSSAAIVIGEKLQNSNEALLWSPQARKGLSAWERRDLGQAPKRWSLD